MYDEFGYMNAPIPETNIEIKRTAELKLALRNFLAGCGASCQEDESNRDILKCYSKLQNGICVEQEIHVGDSDYLCYTNLPGRVNCEDTQAVTDLILAANDINRELRYGNFEVDRTGGTVRFRSFYEPGNEIRLEELDRLLGEPFWAIENYGHIF